LLTTRTSTSLVKRNRRGRRRPVRKTKMAGMETAAGARVDGERRRRTGAGVEAGAVRAVDKALWLVPSFRPFHTPPGCSRIARWQTSISIRQTPCHRPAHHLLAYHQTLPTTLRTPYLPTTATSPISFHVRQSSPFLACDLHLCFTLETSREPGSCPFINCIIQHRRSHPLRSCSTSDTVVFDLVGLTVLLQHIQVSGSTATARCSACFRWKARASGRLRLFSLFVDPGPRLCGPWFVFSKISGSVD
jgi:hypothetical protein